MVEKIFLPLWIGSKISLSQFRECSSLKIVCNISNAGCVHAFYSSMTTFHLSCNQILACVANISGGMTYTPQVFVLQGSTVGVGVLEEKLCLQRLQQFHSNGSVDGC